MIKEVEKRFAENHRPTTGPTHQLRADLIDENDSNSESEDDSARLVEYNRHKGSTYMRPEGIYSDFRDERPQYPASPMRYSQRDAYDMYDREP